MASTMAKPPTEICADCCFETWIIALTIADIVCDFLYFEELYSGNEVPDGVAFVVLTFTVVGLAAFLSGPFYGCAIAVSALVQDAPIIIVTTAIQAYLVGADMRQWHDVAIVSYVFSMLAMLQKLMKLGLVRSLQDVLNPLSEEERAAEIGPCYWWVVFFRSLATVGFTVAVAWALSIFIVLFAPDPPESR